MPVQPIIALEQIATIIAFLIILLALMWFVRRNRGGIASRINANRRMHYIEELPLASQQRVHLIEVDGCTFLVHAGKGHAATFIAVNGEVLPYLIQSQQLLFRPVALQRHLATKKISHS